MKEMTDVRPTSGADDASDDEKLTKERAKTKRAKAMATELHAELSATRKRIATMKRITAAAVVLLVAAVVMVVMNRTNTSAELDGMKQAAAADRATLAAARGAAEEYTSRSLTMDYRRAPEYVANVRRGTTEKFAKNFSTEPGGAGLATLDVLRQTHMVAKGEAAYSYFDGDPNALPRAGQPWNFVVVATQSATTAQQPQGVSNALILRVVVVQQGDAWKVDNFVTDPKIAAKTGQAGLPASGG
ncbi:hypothetical protein HUN08_02125 [Gordonia sp. X0973]|uniref:hypothetical protein n=1 Tax=Gordonia sp. X0973 TaxID=2742602 RepID=UPI000F51F6ED|nr:hypothetical protein [Gordonia sp. X0973]QKT06117.1 hypothetical protein HUN08_02125 [Gordonia sp. X0973]